MPDLLTPQNIGIMVAVGIILLLAITIFLKPIRFLFRLLLNTLLGLVMLVVLNYVGGFIGISLGLNWFNAVVVGIFGLPGIGFLLLLQWLLLI